MGFWYNNAQRFPIETDEALGFVEDLRDRMTPVSRLDCLLLMNGVDHIEAQSEVPAVDCQGERAPAWGQAGPFDPVRLRGRGKGVDSQSRPRARHPHGRLP